MVSFGTQPLESGLSAQCMWEAPCVRSPRKRNCILGRTAHPPHLLALWPRVCRHTHNKTHTPTPTMPHPPSHHTRTDTVKFWKGKLTYTPLKSNFYPIHSPSTNAEQICSLSNSEKIETVQDFQRNCFNCGTPHSGAPWSQGERWGRCIHAECEFHSQLETF